MKSKSGDGERRVSPVPVLARRFLFSKSSDGFLSLITWVSVVGVSLGVLALTVVTSVINGFEGELARVITGMNGDVVLYSRGEPIQDVSRVEAQVRSVLPNVESMTSAFVTELMVSGEHGVAGAVLEGVDLETLGKVTAIPQRVQTGRMPEKEGEIAIGSALASRLEAKVGDQVRIISPITPKSDAMQVVGVTHLGMHEYDSKFVFATIGAVQKFLEQPGKVTSFKIKLKQNSDSIQAALKLSDHFGYPFRAKDWAQLNKNLFYAIRLEKVVIAIILTVIIVVAAFNVVSTLMMMIHDKTKEISILKAMGFRPSQSFRLFCLIGMGIGLVGTVSGALLGLGLNWVLDKTQLIHLPSDIYYIGFLPVVVRWQELGVIAGLALLITFFATLYPAIKVSNRSPLDGLRYE